MTQTVAAPGKSALAEPRLSQRLERTVRDVLNPHPAMAGQALEVPTWMRHEAQRHLVVVEQLCSPVQERHMRTWLMMVNAGVSNAMGEKDFGLRLGAVMLALGETPARVVSEASARDAMRTFQFMPSVAELAAHWSAPARELRSRRDALRKIAAAPEAPEAVRGVELSLEQREAVLAQHRAVMEKLEQEQAQRADLEGRATRQPVTSRPIDPGALSALRDSNPMIQAARIMAKQLGAKSRA